MEALQALGFQLLTLYGLLWAAPLSFTKVSLEGFEFPLSGKFQMDLAKLIGEAYRQSSNQIPGRSLPGAKPHPLGQGSQRSAVGSHLQVSNPTSRAFCIWAMVGRVQSKALQRSAASVREML